MTEKDLEPAAELTAVEEYEQGVRWTDYACSPEPDWEMGEKLYAETDIIQQMDFIFNCMLENAGWTEDQDDTVAEFKNRLEEQIQSQEVEE